jgi:hypothetical protein
MTAGDFEGHPGLRQKAWDSRLRSGAKVLAAVGMFQAGRERRSDALFRQVSRRSLSGRSWCHVLCLRVC